MGGYSHEKKHLIFRKQKRAAGKKTDTWKVLNGESQFLGYIVYRPGWRRYVFRYPPHENYTDFDGKCLYQAGDFAIKETEKLKATWKKRKV